MVVKCASYHIQLIRRSRVRSSCLRMFFVGLPLACLTSIVMTAQGDPEAAKVKNPVAATPESIAAGKQVFQRHCTSCHGING